MGLIMMFLVNLASSQGAPNQTGILLPHPRYRREGIGSTPTAPEYIECDSLTDDKIFQAMFRTPTILKPFLNELLVGNKLIRQELADIEVRGDEQQIRGRDEYNTLHDVRARDSHGNSYVIEMERNCGNFDIVRFQHIGFKIFSKLMDARAKELKEKAEKDAEAATAARKEDAADAARADAMKKRMNEADIHAAVKKAVKAVRKVNPKQLSHSELYRPQDVPTVFMIVVTDGGLPPRTYNSKFESENHYVLTATIDEFEEESRVHFVYIDLARFGHTAMSKSPVSPLDHWCALLWNSKEQRLNKEMYRKLEKIEGISEIARRVVELDDEEQKEAEADAERDEVENKIERIAMSLIRKKVDDVTIIECTSITREKLQELKEQMELD